MLGLFVIKSVAELWKTTQWPSGLISGLIERPLPVFVRSQLTLSSRLVFLSKSYAKMSDIEFWSGGIKPRLAPDSNVRKRFCASRLGEAELAVAAEEFWLKVIQLVVPVWRFRR